MQICYKYDQSTLSEMTNAYIYLPKAVLELETSRSVASNTRTLGESGRSYKHLDKQIVVKSVTVDQPGSLSL